MPWVGSFCQLSGRVGRRMPAQDSAFSASGATEALDPPDALSQLRHLEADNAARIPTRACHTSKVTKSVAFLWHSTRAAFSSSRIRAFGQAQRLEQLAPRRSVAVIL